MQPKAQPHFERDYRRFEQVPETSRREKRPSKARARKTEDETRYSEAFHFIVEMLQKRMPELRIQGSKVLDFEYYRNIDKLTRVLLQNTKDFSGRLSFDQFSQLFDRWVLPRIASGSFFKSPARKTFGKEWSFDLFVRKEAGADVRGVKFDEEADKLFSSLIKDFKTRHPEIHTLYIPRINITEYRGKKASADARMTVIMKDMKTVMPFQGSGEAEESHRHRAIVGEIIKGLRERTGIDLSDKTVDLATQHEAKYQAVTRMLEEADKYFSSQPSGSSYSGKSDTRNL